MNTVEPKPQSRARELILECQLLSLHDLVSWFTIKPYRRNAPQAALLNRALLRFNQDLNGSCRSTVPSIEQREGRVGRYSL
jgi:hypothetical protein